jgi:pimeloyl-ACP methyl ester carboxylesterase
MTQEGDVAAASRPGDDRWLRPLPEFSEPPVPVFAGHQETVGKFRLFVRHGASLPGSEPAVYVHGLGGASTNWTDLMYLLEPYLDGVAPDLPGFGASEPPPDRRYPLSQHIGAVVGLIEARGRGAVHLFGNSLGGVVATSIAAQRPDLVRTLTLISPALPTYRPKRSNVQLPLLMLPGIEVLLSRRVARASVEAQVHAVIELCYADPSLAHPARLADSAEELRRRQRHGHAQDALIGSLRGLLGAYFLTGSRNLWRQAATVQAPTLLIFGRHDKLVDIRIAPRAANTFPKSRLLILDDAGHVAQLEKPRSVAEAVLDHLDDVRG